jgi:hypothetical protein
LVGAVFNSPGKSVVLEPFLSGQFLWLRTGHTASNTMVKSDHRG